MGPPSVGGSHPLGQAHTLAALVRRRIVCLHGPPGVGKSRTAREIGRRFSRAGGEVWICELRSAADLDAGLATILRSLDLEPDGSAIVRRLGVFLAAAQEPLLILDDSDRVGEPLGRVLTTWLSLAPALRIVTTSRAPLRFEAAVEVPLNPLSPDDAVALFEARRSGQGTAPPRVARALVEALDCLPLAVELAAARAAVLPAERILTALADRFAVLSHSAAEANQSSPLWRTVHWSWEMLNAFEQRTLALLSVLPRTFSLALAEAVVGPDCDAERPAYDVLEALVRVGLLSVRDGHRFELLDTVRDFVAAQRPAKTGAWARLLTGLVALGRVDSPAIQPALAAFEALLDRDEGALLQAAWPLVAAALHRARDGRALDLAERVVAHVGPTAASLADLANLHVQARALESGLRFAQRAVGLARSEGDQPAHARALWVQLRAAVHLNEEPLVDAVAADARALLIAHPEVADHGRLRLALGDVERRAGRAETAHDYYLESLEAHRAVGDTEHVAAAQCSLAHLASVQHRPEEALSRSAEALRLLEEVDAISERVHARWRRGTFLKAAGRPDEARAVLAEAVEEAQQAALHIDHACALGVLAELAREADDLTQATTHGRAACDLLDPENEPNESGWMRMTLAMILHQDHRRAEAARAMDQAVDLLRRAGFVRNIALAECRRGTMAAERGDRAVAKAALDAARALIAQASYLRGSHVENELRALQSMVDTRH